MSSTMTATTTPGPFHGRGLLNRSRDVGDDEEDIVSSLQRKLAVSRSKFQNWVEEQKAVCDSVSNQFRTERSVYQQEVDSKLESFLTWQMEKGLNISGPDGSGKETQNPEELSGYDGKEKSLKESITLLRKQVESQTLELESLQQDLKSKDEEADVSRSDSESKIAAQVAFNELQSIIKGYQDLSGLSFEKAEMGRLRFSFRGLDKADRERQFTFLLSTTDDDLYQVEGCEPKIPEDQLNQLIAELHQNDDLGQFFQNIRRTWKNALP